MSLVKLINKETGRSVRVYMHDDGKGRWNSSLSVRRWQEVRKELQCGDRPKKLFMEVDGKFHVINAMEMMPMFDAAHRRIYLRAIPLSPAHGQKKLRKTAG